MRAGAETDGDAKYESPRSRKEKGAPGLFEMPPERFGCQEVRKVEEGRKRRRDRLDTSELEQDLPCHEQACDQDHAIGGGKPGFRGHDRLRLRMRTCSQRDSAELIAIEAASTRRISGYMILLSKLL